MDMYACKSGPFLDEEGCNKLVILFGCHEVDVPNSPLLANPDENQSWVLVDYEEEWFTWVPVRLLQTLNSCKEQAKKMFRLMADCPPTLNIAKFDFTDNLGGLIHDYLLQKMSNHGRPFVLRIMICLADPEEWDDFQSVLTEEAVQEDDIPSGPATEEFIESKLCRFQNENVDDVNYKGDADPCSICLESMSQNVVKCPQMLGKMPCGHVFHDSCIKKWLHISGNCPLCKYECEKPCGLFEQWFPRHRMVSGDEPMVFVINF